MLKDSWYDISKILITNNKFYTFINELSIGIQFQIVFFFLKAFPLKLNNRRNRL